MLNVTSRAAVKSPNFLVRPRASITGPWPVFGATFSASADRPPGAPPSTSMKASSKRGSVAAMLGGRECVRPAAPQSIRAAARLLAGHQPQRIALDHPVDDRGIARARRVSAARRSPSTPVT